MKTNWLKVNNFERKEWRYKPDIVLPELVYLVDNLTDFIKRAFSKSAFCIIHQAFEATGHENNSLHYPNGNGKVRAVDLHFETISLINQYLSAERFPFTGIGCYPLWRNPGLHLEIEDGIIVPGKRWMKTSAGYVGISSETIQYILPRDFANVITP